VLSSSAFIIYFVKNIERGKYRVISISPELASSPEASELWKNTAFNSKLLYVVLDEALCVSQWGTAFRNSYLHIGNLRYMIPRNIPFFAASATLPDRLLRDVLRILRFRLDQTDSYTHLNDRPTIHLAAQKMDHGHTTYLDLDFLIPDSFSAQSQPPPKILIFF
jgi:superfamily II DNA helicase RecQ